MSPLTLALSGNSRDVLEKLLLAPGPVSTAEVGRQIGLSPAQVRHALRAADLWLRERAVRLVKTPRVGLSVAAPPLVRRQMLDELRQLLPSGLSLAPDERRSLLLLRLLLAESPIPQQDLAAELAVSRTSFFRDLAAVRLWLEKRGLGSHTSRRKGVWVSGAEGRRRQALLELLRSNLDEGQLIALCLPGASGTARTGLLSRFAAAAGAFVSRLDLAGAGGQVSILEKELGGAFSDQARAVVALYLAVARHRLERGRPVGPGSVQAGCAPSVLSRVESALQSAVGSSLPPEELGFMAAPLAEALATGLLSRDDAGFLSRAPRVEEEGAGDRELATALAKESARYLNARLFRDGELVDCLTLELAGPAPADRAQAPAAADSGANPLLGFTQRVLGPLLIAHGRTATRQLLTALAIHLETAMERLGRGAARRRVWVVCGAGVATARNLITRLNLYCRSWRSWDWPRPLTWHVTRGWQPVPTH
jgi:mannitol operon transcriptional antiterminator